MSYSSYDLASGREKNGPSGARSRGSSGVSEMIGMRVLVRVVLEITVGVRVRERTGIWDWNGGWSMGAEINS